MTSQVSENLETITTSKNLKYLGYYFPDGQYGDFFDKVKGFTNTYDCWVRMQYSHFGDEPNSTWRKRMSVCLKRAHDEGKYIRLALNMQNKDDAKPDFIAKVLQIVKPYWDKVVVVELADEPTWDKLTTKKNLQLVRGLIEPLGSKPLGINYTTDKGLADTSEWQRIVNLPQLDFVGLECYLPLGNPNIGVMKDNVRYARGKLPAGKQVWLVMQAYTRNGSLTLAQTLPAQWACYKLGQESPRTIGITMFSYGRRSGTFEYPALEMEHKHVAKAMGII